MEPIEQDQPPPRFSQEQFVYLQKEFSQRNPIFVASTLNGAICALSATALRKGNQEVLEHIGTLVGPAQSGREVT